MRTRNGESVAFDTSAACSRLRLWKCRRTHPLVPLTSFWQETAWALSRSITHSLIANYSLLRKCVPSWRVATFAPVSRPTAIPAYLLFGSVCEPSTLVEGVASLPPGHSLRISLDEMPHSVAPTQYWNAESANETIAIARGSREGVSSTQEVRRLLGDAVTSHLVADVPVGVFLSGGIDSTAIAALASKSQGGIHTFTVAFPDAEFSEAEQARRTARLLGTEHRELILSDHDMIAQFDDALGAFDQPSMDGINTFFVSWAAHQAGLKVALSGVGSDETFGGYASFRARSALAYASVAGRLLPRSLRRASGGAMSLTGEMLAPTRSFAKSLSRISVSRSVPRLVLFYTFALHAGHTRRAAASRLCFLGNVALVALAP